MVLLSCLEVLLLLTLFCQVTCIYENKRIVYHSDNDVISVITALEKEITSFKNTTVDLESKVAALERNVRASDNKINALESEQTISKIKVAEYKNKTEALEKEASITKNRIRDLESQLEVLKITRPDVGVTYVRWGRTTCPSNGTEYVYKGYMAGTDYTEVGGGSNNLCLPEDPTWSMFVDGYDNGATIYGTEIEPNSHVSSTLFGKQTYNQDIPCAVCRSTRASQVMLPARSNCYAGWTMEYTGYIVSTYVNQKGKSDLVGLDAGLEFVPHGAGDDEDHVLRPVEVRCGIYGSLPCPPYVDGRELACVVCAR